LPAALPIYCWRIDGVQNLNSLVPILHTNPGWTIRSLVVASVLLFIGVAGRLALWPVHSWITKTSVSAPPAALAITQTVWSVVGIVVLYRLMPIFVASNQQTLRACISFTLVAALAAPLLGLLGNEPKRAITLAGSGAVAIAAALVLDGFQVKGSTFAIAGVAAALAIAPARAAGILAAASIASAMRTDDLTEMGDAWRKMRVSSGALLGSALVMGMAVSGALAFTVPSRSWLGFALGDAVLLIAIGGLRIFLASSFGPLRRRRAFEPDRVREAPGPSLGWPYWLVAAGSILLVASLVRGWLDFLDGQKHPVPGAGSFVIWVAVAVVGFAAVSFAYLRNKDRALAASATGGAWLARLTATGAALVDRFLVAPTTDLARRVGDWIPAGDGALGRAVEVTGQFAIASGRLGAIPLVTVLAVVLALVIALLTPGVWR
jgi:NADH:ubiquinone oxidoreductase subunit 5 (subunit L)/multisubunit Na+/H+ antiporter MnhA subunit